MKDKYILLLIVLLVIIFFYYIGNTSGINDVTQVIENIIEKYTSRCPIKGTVGDWSACSKLCGKGTQTRSRATTISPPHGNHVCQYLQDERKCNTRKCTKEDVTIALRNAITDVRGYNRTPESAAAWAPHVARLTRKDVDAELAIMTHQERADVFGRLQPEILALMDEEDTDLSPIQFHFIAPAQPWYKHTEWTELNNADKELYNTSVTDLCEGVILPDGWGCYKKKMDFSNDNWKTDNSINEFYIYNPRKDKIIYFNSTGDLNQKLTYLETNNPIVKNKISHEAVRRITSYPSIKWPLIVNDIYTPGGEIIITNEAEYNAFITKKKNSKNKYFIALP